MNKLTRILIPVILLVAAFFAGNYYGKNCSYPKELPGRDSLLLSKDGLHDSGRKGKRGKYQAKRLERQHQHLKNKISKRLELSPEQQNKLDVIIEDKKLALKTLQEEMQPKMKAHKDDFRSKVVEILNPEQKEEFKKMRLENKGKKHRRSKKRND